ncbi:DUF892 family protein [Paraburkholderia megapolitana]|uniref:Ferritin-like metal-binding protein YciE n=2 Tax=Paraburkholderia megapolitana TaxID=420953 RepID=A0A1I3Q6P9_9BURK|nr:DUF892 family protein [Paraburkholderia megapolitana]SFJ29262.1 Ferritin-like metal-binding protein YciE [Paraburkholderia megapolitana]
MEFDAERLLRKLNTGPVHDTELASHIATSLRETLEHRMQMASCIERINGAGNEDDTQMSMEDIPAIPEARLGRPPESERADLERLYDEITREIATQTSLVALAEAGGFFETRLICDAVLSQKSIAAAWLRDRLDR